MLPATSDLKVGGGGGGCGWSRSVGRGRQSEGDRALLVAVDREPIDDVPRRAGVEHDAVVELLEDRRS